MRKMSKLIIILSSLMLCPIIASANDSIDMTDRVNKLMKNPNLTNTSSDNATNIHNHFNNWKNNGKMSEDIQSLVGSNKNSDDSVDMAPVKTDYLAVLEIKKGTGNSISLDIDIKDNQLNNSLLKITNITGVCSGKFTVSDRNMNKQLCNAVFDYTDNAQISGKSEQEKEVIKSHVCYKLKDIISWSFNINKEKKQLNPVPASGHHCNNFLPTGITVSQEQELKRQLENTLVQHSGLAKVDYEGGKYIFYKLSTSDNAFIDAASKGDNKEFEKIMNHATNKDPKKKPTDEDNKKLVDQYLKDNNSDAAKALSMARIPQDKKLDKDYHKKLSSSNKEIYENIDWDTAKDVSNNLRARCGNPTCTVEVIKEEQFLDKEGKTKTSKTKDIVFRSCIPNGFKEVSNGLKETVYECPITNKPNELTETIKYQKDGQACSCKNEHKMKENIKKVMVGTTMIKVVRDSACGERSEEDNKTVDKIMQARQECSKSSGGDAVKYEECMKSQDLNK